MASDLLGALRRHQPADEAEAADLETIRRFVERHADPFDRRIADGHLTGSALVVSASGRRVLLVHHRKLGRWLQPGGHADPGEASGEAVALREAREETGITDLTLHPTAPRPLDVDVHAIPARPGEPAHDHLDLRYLVLAPDGVPATRAALESSDLRWFDWSDLTSLDLDDGLRRALAKATAWLSRGSASEISASFGLGGLRARSGHFVLESGYHTDLWFSLDTLFLDPAAIAPRVDSLAAIVRPHGVTAICGPLLGGAFLAQALANALGARFYFCEPAPPASPSGLFAARYRLPPGQLSAAAAERFAVVDDVISAGSSVRAVVEELNAHRFTVTVIGSLLLLGRKAVEHFGSVGLPVVAVERRPFRTWEPSECPLCKAASPAEAPPRRRG